MGAWGVRLKPVLNWANVCSPEHTSDTSTNYDSFLNGIFSSLNMVWTVQTLLHSQLDLLSSNQRQRSSNRANVPRTSVERSFLDPEYSFDEYFQLGSRRKVRPIKNQLASPNTSN